MTNDPKTAVMICGHGSRDMGAVEQFNALSRHLAKRMPQYDMESGFLEFASPVIHDGLLKLKARGARRILCLPGMLFAASHVKNDLPSEINEFAASNPQIDMRYGRELAIDSRLLEAAASRISEAEEKSQSKALRQETLLMVAGRGTTDSDANSNVAKVARMLWEGMGFGWSLVSYSGVAYPLVNEGLAHAVKLGFKRIIVFPYFLFTGVLVKRIYDWTDEAAKNNPQIEFLKAPYLNDHSLVIDCLVERVAEMLNGGNLMNCQLCKYRERIIGYEDDQGALQVAGHHHVRGAGTDDACHHDHHHHSRHHDHKHDHKHGRKHDHKHGHGHDDA